MEQKMVANTTPWRLGKGPFIFIGIPPIVTGELELENPTDRKVKVRSIPTTGPKDKALAVRGLDEIKVKTRLTPQIRLSQPAHFNIDQHTPPGTYETEIVCDDQREIAIIHVLENPDFDIAPSRIIWRGGGGDRLSHVLVLRNHGNVSHTLHEVGMIWLEEQDWVGRTFVYSLRDAAEKEKEHQAFLDRVLEQFKKSMVHTVQVSLTYDKAELKPGDTRQVMLDITLPDSLKKGRTYFGFVKLMGKRLWVEVRCTHSGKSLKATRRKE
jgi:hypothetical protein